MRTEPSAPTEANISLPPPARLKEMSYTCNASRQREAFEMEDGKVTQRLMSISNILLDTITFL